MAHKRGTRGGEGEEVAGARDNERAEPMAPAGRPPRYLAAHPSRPHHQAAPPSAATTTSRRTPPMAPAGLNPAAAPGSSTLCRLTPGPGRLPPRCPPRRLPPRTQWRPPATSRAASRRHGSDQIRTLGFQIGAPPAGGARPSRSRCGEEGIGGVAPAPKPCGGPASAACAANLRCRHVTPARRRRHVRRLLSRAELRIRPMKGRI
uniref:Uncharacterized protein n=1 Tax=Oryza meridionalis TaxID=40149 RepID=A0A0E0C8E2_9ORYZ